MEAHINKTDFVVKKINYYNRECGENKVYFTKVFMDIYADGLFDIVQIKSQLDSPNELSCYDYYNDYWILSNGIKITFSDDNLNDYNCDIVDNNLNKTNEYYFIMEKNIFDFKYKEFLTKLHKLFNDGFSFCQIKFLFNEFVKDEINIL